MVSYEGARNGNLMVDGNKMGNGNEMSNEKRNLNGERKEAFCNGGEKKYWRRAT